MLRDRHLNEEMEGVVTSVVNFGLFVQLEKYLVEGLIAPHDVRRFVEEGKKKGKGKSRKNRKKFKGAGRGGKFVDTCPFKLGQEVRVKIVDVNIAARTVDLIPV